MSLNDACKLTIAIPTYDRLPSLQNTLNAIRDQGNARVEVLVVDNASPTPVEEMVRSTLNGTAFARVKIVRNPFNIGLAGNILRCFELCNGEWMHLLGDDDLPNVSLVDTILETVDGVCGKVAQINFASNICVRDQTISVIGIEEFVKQLDSVPNLNYISTNIYRINKFCTHLRCGYHFAGTMTPHTAMTLSVAGEGEVVVLSDRHVVKCPPQSSNSKTWSWLQLCLYQPLLLEHPALDDQTRLVFSKKLRSYAKVHEKNVAALLRIGQQRGRRKEITFLYTKFYERWYGYPFDFKAYMKSVAYALILRAPRISFAILIKLLILFGRSEKAAEYAKKNDRFQRM